MNRIEKDKKIGREQCKKGWKHMAKNYRTKEEKEIAILQSSNKFEVLKSRVMEIREGSRKVEKDR